MNKCPVCGEELKEIIIEEEKPFLYAQQNPEKGGYFGESPREYGSSGYGDLYDMVPCKIKYLKCLKCDYQHKA